MTGGRTPPHLHKGDIVQLKDFRDRFATISNIGFVKSTRPGATAVGHLLEELLGIEENSIALPDLGEAELKAMRSDASSMLTLFTTDRGAWQIEPREAITRYGTIDQRPAKDGRPNLYGTFVAGASPNPQGLFLAVDDIHVSVRSTDGTTLARWPLNDLSSTFARKIPALVYVLADSRHRDGAEHFHYRRAYILGGTSASRFREQLSEGRIKVDLRLHLRDHRGPRPKVRNHGTGFRIMPADFPRLFSTQEKLYESDPHP